MRTQGAKDLTPKKKARILAKKNTQEYSTREIARQEGVSQKTVSNYTEWSLPPEVVEMSKRYHSHFATLAEANAFKAELRVFDDINNISADKASKVAETQFNLARTIKGESTTNSQFDKAKLANTMLERAISNGAKKDDAITYICELMGVGKEVFDS